MPLNQVSCDVCSACVCLCACVCHAVLACAGGPVGVHVRVIKAYRALGEVQLCKPWHLACPWKDGGGFAGRNFMPTLPNRNPAL